jgi:hypothetical protein
MSVATIYPSKNVFVNIDLPDTNYSGAEYLDVGRVFLDCIPAGSSNNDTWLQFDLSTIPDDAIISNVLLYFSAYLTCPNYYDTSVYIYNMPEFSWSESTITWNNAPTSSTPSTSSSSVTVSFSSPSTWKEFNFSGSIMVGDVQSALVDNVLCYRMIPEIDAGTVLNGARMRSSYFTGAGQELPYLEVTYDNGISITTTSISSITNNSASGGGNITGDGVTERGVCWNTSINPTISNSHTSDGSGSGSFSSSLTSLSAGIFYYVRAYATTSQGTSYGDTVTFTTLTVPSINTAGVDKILSNSAESGGNVTSDGGYTVTERGVCWNTSINPTIANSHTSDGSGTGLFDSSITSLSPSTGYYVRAYATNSLGTSYGDNVFFTTSSADVAISTSNVTSITATSATCGGNITSDGGYSITERGVCWNTSIDPTIANSHTSDGSGTGSFVSGIINLVGGTTYYVRAYATNTQGTSYGSNVMFISYSSNMNVPDTTTFSEIDVVSSVYYYQTMPSTPNLSDSFTYAEGPNGGIFDSLYEGAHTSLYNFRNYQYCISSTQSDPISGNGYYCPSSYTTLTVVGGSLGTNAVWVWYKQSLPDIEIDRGVDYIIVNSTNGAGTYKVRAEGTCGNTDFVSKVVSAYTSSTAPTSITGNASFCVGSSTTLTVNGGSLGTNASWCWWLNSCGPGSSKTGVRVGYGTSITVSVAGSYYVRAEGTCNTTSCASKTITSSSYPVSVTISPVNPVRCIGSSVQFTATPTNQGSSPTYNWYRVRGGVTTSVGTNSTTYLHSSIYNGDAIYCKLTSNVSCPTGNPAYSYTSTCTLLSTQSLNVHINSIPADIGGFVTVNSTDDIIFNCSVSFNQTDPPAPLPD